MSWINDMKAIIQADELAKDVAGAEALLERHQEHKVRRQFQGRIKRVQMQTFYYLFVFRERSTPGRTVFDPLMKLDKLW